MSFRVVIAGVWLPMEWDEFQEVQGPSYALTNHTHLKCSFSADPDHQALGSFRPASFVTNGTRVAFAGEPRNQPVVRVWHNGHILTRQASKESPDTATGSKGKSEGQNPKSETGQRAEGEWGKKEKLPKPLGKLGLIRLHLIGIRLEFWGLGSEGVGEGKEVAGGSWSPGAWCGTRQGQTRRHTRTG